MKKHYLKKGGGTTLLGHKDTGYSVYKNPDDKLREEIKNFKGDQTKVTLGWPEKNGTLLSGRKKKLSVKAAEMLATFQLKKLKRL